MTIVVPGYCSCAVLVQIQVQTWFAVGQRCVKPRSDLDVPPPLDELLERLKQLPDVSHRITYLCVMGVMMRFDQAHITTHADVTARYI